MDKFGLIGRNIDYSFSRGYFKSKFKKEGIKATYENFDIPKIEDFPTVLTNTKKLKGLNVTIPYKEGIIPYLDEMSGVASEIGAVNTIRFKKSGLKGYNTDQYGFRKSITKLLKPRHKNALVLGSGGASKAIAYALKRMDIGFDIVSRKASDETLVYSDLNKAIIQSHLIIVNCTPLGTHPNIDQAPPIPYHFLGKHHLLYDLVYNPEESLFLKKGKEQGARTKNGHEMLVLQAEKAWEIWNR